MPSTMEWDDIVRKTIGELNSQLLLPPTSQQRGITPSQQPASVVPQQRPAPAPAAPSARPAGRAAGYEFGLPTKEGPYGPQSDWGKGIRNFMEVIGYPTGEAAAQAPAPAPAPQTATPKPRPRSKPKESSGSTQKPQKRSKTKGLAPKQASVETVPVSENAPDSQVVDTSGEMQMLDRTLPRPPQVVEDPISYPELKGIPARSQYIPVAGVPAETPYIPLKTSSFLRPEGEEPALYQVLNAMGRAGLPSRAQTMYERDGLNVQGRAGLPSSAQVMYERDGVKGQQDMYYEKDLVGAKEQTARKVNAIRQDLQYNSPEAVQERAQEAELEALGIPPYIPVRFQNPGGSLTMEYIRPIIKRDGTGKIVGAYMPGYTNGYGSVMPGLSPAQFAKQVSDLNALYGQEKSEPTRTKTTRRRLRDGTVVEDTEVQSKRGLDTQGVQKGIEAERQAEVNATKAENDFLKQQILAEDKKSLAEYRKGRLDVDRSRVKNQIGKGKGRVYMTEADKVQYQALSKEIESLNKLGSFLDEAGKKRLADLTAQRDAILPPPPVGKRHAPKGTKIQDKNGKIKVADGNGNWL